MASDFSTAAAATGNYAGQQFDQAYDKLIHSPFDQPVSNLTPEQKKELASWQGQMAASYKQLGDARKQAQQQAGYDQVVALMTTTTTMAATVTNKIVTIMNALPTSTSSQSEIAFHYVQIGQINALRDVLNALAALSPVAVWERESENGSKT